jgi:hypothetical protein
MKKIMLVISMSLVFMHLQTFASQPSKSNSAWMLAQPIIATAGAIFGTGLALYNGYALKQTRKDARRIKSIKQAVLYNRQPHNDRISIIEENVQDLSDFCTDERTRQKLVQRAPTVTDPRYYERYAKQLDIAPYNHPDNFSDMDAWQAQSFVSDVREIERKNNKELDCKRQKRQRCMLGATMAGMSFLLLLKLKKS